MRETKKELIKVKDRVVGLFGHVEIMDLEIIKKMAVNKRVWVYAGIGLWKRLCMECRAG